MDSAICIKRKEILKEHKKYNLYLLPLFATLVITPLIVHLYRFDSHLESYSWYNNTNENSDFFLYYKAIFLIAMSAIMLAIIGYTMYKERKKRVRQFEIINEYWLIGLGIFLFFACFSTLVSKYRYFGVHGIADQFEPILVIIGYCIVMVYTYYMVNQREHIQVIKAAILTLCSLIGILGLFQLIGMDFWASKLGRILMISSKYADQRESLEFAFAKSGTPVYLSLYNINYVGVFCVLMVPILVSILIAEQNKMYKLVTAIDIALMLICLIGCGSKTGVLIAALLAVIAAIMFFKGKKKIYTLGILVVLAVVVFAGYYIVSGNNLWVRLADSLKPVRNQYAVTDFVLEDEDVYLTYNEHKMYLQTDVSTDTGIQFRAWSDTNDNLVYYQDTEGTVHFEDEEFKDITLNIYAQVNDLDFVMVVNANGQYYRFTVIDGQYQFVNSLGRVDELVKADTALFTNYDALFSGRGYIWARTIPLLKKTIFVGTGADSFALVFPQNDYVAAQNAGYGEQIVTKPHNLYLQIAVQYGVLALLGFLFMYGFYFWQTIKALRESKKTTETILAKGIMIGLIGYCLMGITNDSCITVAPLSFIFLGLGFSVNRILHKNAKMKGNIE